MSASNRTLCPSRTPELTWVNQAGRRRGKCDCGFEGWVTQHGKLYQHQREALGFDHPGLTSYQPSYEPMMFGLDVCHECGSLVADQVIHDEWHNSVVEDLTLLRKEAVT